MSSAFDALDRNHDGVITRSEFSAAMAAPATTIVGGSTNAVIAPTMGYVQQAAPITTYTNAVAAPTEFSNYVIGSTSNYVKPAAAITTSNFVKGATYTNAVAAPSYQFVQPQSTSNFVKPAASVATYTNAVAAPSFQYVQPQAQYARAAAIAPATSITVPQATSVFNTIDTNGDGKITRAEFSNYVTGTTNVVTAPTYNVVQQPSYNVVQQPAVSTVFNTIDTSNYVKPAASIATYSNAVAAPSYAVAAPSYEYVQPQAASVFSTIDTNGDGKISRSEFANFIGQPLATTYAPSPAAYSVGRYY